MFAKSVVTYDGLPVESGGAHHLRTRDPRVALAQVGSFLDSCTAEPSELRFTVNLLSAEEEGIPKEWTQFLLRRFSDTYGESMKKALGRTLEYSWSIAESDMETQVNFITSLGSLPVHQYGAPPLYVTAHRVCKLTDGVSGAPWPHQDPSSYAHFQVSGYGEALGRSTIYARISERSSISLFLNFPFEPEDPELQRAVRRVQENLPFSLSKSHWKHWKLTKAGDKYLGRKMTSPLGVGF